MRQILPLVLETREGNEMIIYKVAETQTQFQSI